MDVVVVVVILWPFGGTFWAKWAKREHLVTW